MKLTSGAETSRHCFGENVDGREASAAALRILVVDDDPVSLDLIAMRLQKRGHAVRKAEGGVSGIAQLDEGGNEFDLILVDYRMPGLSGVEILRMALSRSCAPVGIYTGEGSPSEREALDAGAAAFLGDKGSASAFEAFIEKLERLTRRSREGSP